MSDPTRAPAFATPVYITTAPGALAKNYSAAISADLIYDGAGYVASLIVNTGDTGATVELFDGDPGGSGVSLGIWDAATAGSTIALGIPFTTSLYATIVNDPNVTITYVPST